MTNIRNIDLNLLVAFNALYDARNVTRAAESLALTQPTVSGMLTRLRDLFGDPLFIRTQHGVLPTPRADALFEPVKAILEAAEALVAGDEFDPRSAEMIVSISANDYMQHTLVVPFIERLRKQAPGVRLAIMPAYIDDLSEKLARGTVDLALSTPDFAGPDLPRRLLYTERYVCVARRRHPLRGPKLSLEDFSNFDHVLVSPTGGGFSGPGDDALRERGAGRTISVSLPSFHVMLETIRTDDFLALVPERFLNGKMAGLKIFEPPVQAPDFDVICCWHRRVDADPAQRWIRNQMAAVANA